MRFSWNGLQITGTYLPGEAAQTQGDPDSYSPGTAPEFEVESATINDVKEWCEFLDAPVLDWKYGTPMSINMLDSEYRGEVFQAASDHYDGLRQDQLDLPEVKG